MSTTATPTQQTPPSAPPKEVAVKIIPEERWLEPTNRGGLEQFIPSVRNQLARALPRFLAGQADRLIRCMITEVTRNPALMECTPLSLFGSVIQSGQLGLCIGGPLGEAYIIPYKNGALSKKMKRDVKDAQLIIGYKGIIQLGYRSSALRRITPVPVRKGDKFAFARGLNQDLIHEPLRNNRNPVTDYYVVLELMNGGRDFETFTVEDAVEFRDRYATVRGAPDYVRDKSPWYDITPERTGAGFDAMALKTLVRRIGKRTPLSVEWNTAIGLDEAGETGIEQNLGAIVDMQVQPIGKVDELQGRLDGAKNGSTNDSDPTPFQQHAKAIEEAETAAEVDRAKAAVFDDERVARGDRARLASLAEERLRELASGKKPGDNLYAGGTEQVDTIKG